MGARASEGDCCEETAGAAADYNRGQRAGGAKEGVPGGRGWSAGAVGQAAEVGGAGSEEGASHGKERGR